VVRTEALPSSNAQLTWRTDIVARGDPVSVPVAPRSPWRPFISSVDFYLHRFRASAAVRRFAPTAHATVRTLKDEFAVALHFRSDDNRPAAIGFEIEVDGFRLDVVLPSGEQSSASLLSPQTLRGAKLAYLRERFRDDARLPPELNGFQRDWLFQMLAAALAAAAASGRDVASLADDLLSDARIDDAFRDVMHVYFGSLPFTPPDDADEDFEEDGSEGEDDQGESAASQTMHAAPRLQKALALHLVLPEVREGLRAIAREALTPDSAAFDAWLRRLVLETLGEAMLQACMTAAPRQATLDNLLVDIREGSADRPASIWITETTLGGAGVLQSFAERFAGEPNSFFDAVEAALAPTDFELVDGGLRRILVLACSDPDVRNGMVRLRATESHSGSAEVWRELSATLTKHGGVDLSHALVVALNSRLLRPGAGPAFDELLAGLAAHWDSLENRLGIAVGLREFSYAVSSNKVWGDRVRAHVSTNLPGVAAANVSVFSAVFGMLWPRESEVRRTSLSAYNPYRSARATDPAVVRELLLRRTVRTVELSTPSWREALYAAFAEDGACRLRASTAQARELRAALVLLGATPADVGVLQFFPVVERIQRGEDCILVDLLLREHA
jgi:hypothetical protein